MEQTMLVPHERHLPTRQARATYPARRTTPGSRGGVAVPPPGIVARMSWRIMDNWKTTLASRPAWQDHGMAILGGLMYVIVPTAIEAIFGRDLTGWRGYITSVAANLVVGGAAKSPGYMAGTLGAALAHLTYARLQDPLFLKVFGKYGFRFDPTVVTSSMSDQDEMPAPMPELPRGTTIRSVAGENIAAFPLSPIAASVGLVAAPIGAGAPGAMAAAPNEQTSTQAMTPSRQQPLQPVGVSDFYTRSLADGSTEGDRKSMPHSHGITPPRARVRIGYGEPFNSGWTSGMK